MATNNSADYSPTQYNTQVGGANGTMVNISPSATAGIPFVSGGSSANPSFTTAVVAGGGTGAVSFTSNGILYGSGTSPIGVTAAGTTGQVLTATTSSAPSWENPAASSITITGDTGGALTGNAFTFTGGTTGLSYGGSGSTETLSGTLAIANGGTNATSMATSTGIVKYDGTRLVTSSTAKIDSSNRQTNSSQPAFFANLSSSVTNVTGDSTVYTVAFNNVIFDNGSNFNTGTATFTAPVTGIYFFGWNLYMQNIGAAHSDAATLLNATSVANTEINQSAAFALSAGGELAIQGSRLVSMSATDTLTFKLVVVGSTKTVGLFGSNTDPRTYLNGYLIC
jgi:hypothetical protein